mmetsp:Transcript_8101/g.23926  ORF Transcript_8101/g.23926 Transcript_8101/m.23926 type:complete len:273 (+) Transcript_8101:1138-1956(+)
MGFAHAAASTGSESQSALRFCRHAIRYDGSLPMYSEPRSRRRSMSPQSLIDASRPSSGSFSSSMMRMKANAVSFRLGSSESRMRSELSAVSSTATNTSATCQKSSESASCFCSRDFCFMARSYLSCHAVYLGSTNSFCTCALSLSSERTQMISVAKRVSAGMSSASTSAKEMKMAYTSPWLMMNRISPCTCLRFTLNGFAQSSISRSARWPLQPSASSTIASSSSVRARAQPPPRSVMQILTMDDFFLVMIVPAASCFLTSEIGPAFSIAWM